MLTGTDPALTWLRPQLYVPAGGSVAVGLAPEGSVVWLPNGRKGTYIRTLCFAVPGAVM